MRGIRTPDFVIHSDWDVSRIWMYPIPPTTSWQDFFFTTFSFVCRLDDNIYIYIYIYIYIQVFRQLFSLDTYTQMNQVNIFGASRAFVSTVYIYSSSLSVLQLPLNDVCDKMPHKWRSVRNVVFVPLRYLAIPESIWLFITKQYWMEITEADISIL